MDTVLPSQKLDWELPNISISYRKLELSKPTILRSQDESESVRMHFGLRGAYTFQCEELSGNYSLSGHHNNILYSQNLTLNVQTESREIETFGVNFTPSEFIRISQGGSDKLKQFAEAILQKKPGIFNRVWKFNSMRIQKVIDSIIDESFPQNLQETFLQAKAIELLVLQAEIHGREENSHFIKTKRDRNKIFQAKEIISHRFAHPPTIAELAKMVETNDFKLKKGFREIFGASVFSYVLYYRMHLARQLLIDTDQQIKNIALEVGYSTPQHFSTAFRKHFGAAPKMVRKNPDLATLHTR